MISNCSFLNVIARNVFKADELGLEIVHIALPTLLALLADPVASLVDTAFVGHIGLSYNKDYLHSTKS